MNHTSKVCLLSPKMLILIFQATGSFTSAFIFMPQFTTFINQTTEQRRCRNETKESHEDLLKAHGERTLAFRYNPNDVKQIRDESRILLKIRFSPIFSRFPTNVFPISTIKILRDGAQIRLCKQENLNG